MFNRKQFNRQLALYTFAALALSSGGCVVISLISALIMIPGLVTHEWAFLHVLAMFAMAGAFAVLAACFATLYDLANGFFRTEGGE